MMEKASKYHEELRRKLLEKGLRITEQRKGMLKLLLQAEYPLTATEIYQVMSMEFAGLSYGTVYQNIKLFSELKLLESFAVGNELRFRLVDMTQPQYHIICQDCGKMVSFGFDPEQLQLKLPENFKLYNFHIDNLGLCEICKTEDDSIESNCNLGLYRMR